MSPNILTFIIPVRHQQNASNWAHLKKNLSQTIISISKQDHKGWKAIIVANKGADLPLIPAGFEIKWVDFPPNPIYRQGSTDKEIFYEACRMDKGRRILAGMLHAGEMGHVMIVDDDDLISRRLTSYVEKNREANGWYIYDGFIWGDSGYLLYNFNDFSRLCGTSHIIRADLYKIPDNLETANSLYISRMLGSHIFIQDILSDAGTPLERLPFIGAVYRTGHAEAHSRSRGILRQFFIRKHLLQEPREFLKRIQRLRFKTHILKKEFFGLE